MGAPKFLLSHLKLINSNNYLNAGLPMEDNKYPVLVFSHGLGTYPEQNILLMEDLASHGYVIFSINHTYFSMFSKFPDGRITENLDDEAAVDAESSRPEIAEFIEELFASRDTADISEKLDKAIKMAPKTVASEISKINIWSADQIFVLDEVKKLSSGERSSIFSGRLDLSRIGVFGFSMGGKATMQTCAQDERCHAGINIDGFSLVSHLEKPQSRPFMHLSNAENYFVEPVYEKAIGPSYSIRIAGTKHVNYTDLSIFSDLFKVIGLVGEIDGYRILKIENDYVGGFFDKHLKKRDVPLSNGPPDIYPEASFKSKNTQ